MRLSIFSDNTRSHFSCWVCERSFWKIRVANQTTKTIRFTLKLNPFKLINWIYLFRQGMTRPIWLWHGDVKTTNRMGRSMHRLRKSSNDPSLPFEFDPHIH